MSNPLVDIWHELHDGNQLYPPPTLLSKHLHRADALSLFEASDFQAFTTEILGDHIDTNSFPFTSVSEFLISNISDGTNPVLDPSQHQMFETARLLPFLVSIKKYITDQIGSTLRARFFSAGIPSQGVCLAFTRGLKSAYLITYDLRNAIPEVRIIERFDEPKGLMEVESIPKLKDPLARNLAKSFLTSGHKIILQSGILTHVDRRVDFNVFGPTIDTLFLADILLRDSDYTSGRVLEVGSGSGHLISLAACKLENIISCTAVDINSTSILCTWRNLTENIKHNNRNINDNYGVIGPFDVSLFSSRFDLVVCNPPYVALPPAQILADPTKYTEAVAGIQLLTNLLKNLDQLLNPGGRLLLMGSSTSLSAVSDAAPPDYEIQLAYEGEGMKVPFDVEAVLSDQGWINYLLELGVLEASDDTYWHKLQPVWLKRGSV